ncbi:uncharacterized protein PV07_03231 [Cladophialophora immunda]|uniref:Uncharacterized protein n=1 Tax=Cladophialophora immunda TaxID=569365 RepID=A0A0D1ZU33_9EURO|nr:uncharacterized protein PV07_03231 [Cladophialophora immunda]KIW31601.1 hypothetical protein PV07_03231 [Cladophialophora immunda]OQV04343.1 hypothetical protein CLAIMM_09239 [Cladophialophora immunda]
MEQLSALSSHDPRCFASKPQPQPQTQPETASQSAARLLFKSHWKLNTESSREEPRLRRLLGHISVYDRTRTFAQAEEQTQPSEETRPEPNELSTYIQQHQVPSFKEFQAALEAQLATIAQIRAAAEQYNNAEEYNSDEEEEDDSDYDSCDGDWSDEEDTSAESDDSCTDYESEGQRSECSSPTFDSADAKYGQDESEEDDDVWAIRPLIPLVSNRSADSG